MVTGHSLFFRTLFQRCCGAGAGGPLLVPAAAEGEAAAAGPDRFPGAEALGKRKLQNGACIAVEVRFGSPFGGGEQEGAAAHWTPSASIVSAEMCFGSCLA